MASSSSKTPLDLNEVLRRLSDARRTTYKDKEGRPYAAVYEKDIRTWYLALSQAIETIDDSSVQDELKEAREQASQLLAASAAKDARFKEMEAKIQHLEEAHAVAVKHRDATVKDLKAQLEVQQQAAADANLDKQATAKWLAEARAELKQPAAKFDPQAASDLKAQITALESDLAAANEATAEAKANISSLRKRLDSAHKELASSTAELNAAKAEKATFSRQLAAARHHNVELFDKDTLDYASLELAFGPAALAKLKAVLAVETFDVRGRISKLTGFFHVASNHASSRFKAFLGLLRHALEVLKDASSTYVAILAPWVNAMVKDIVTLKLQGVSHYRASLEMAITSVKKLPPKSTLAVKSKAGREAVGTRPSWRSIAAANRKKVASLLVKLKTMAVKISVEAREAYTKFSAKVKSGAKQCQKLARVTLTRIRVAYLLTHQVIFGVSRKEADTLSTTSSELEILMEDLETKTPDPD